ncbi:MAG: carboxypeptidase regulatory-like domain-containing protein [Candidatus Zixiibacteriota bacterium]|nr:MAG: carboxypeptidase regulatory-like domain-containing protein [candidate division Zixibacteria bacterium]
MKRILSTALLVMLCQLAVPTAVAQVDELLKPYETGDKEFERHEIGKLIVFWHQRMIGDAIVEKDQIVYQFDKATEELLAVKTQWRDDLTDIEAPNISEGEAEAIAGGEPLFSNLYIISPESDVIKLDPVPRNPCWVVRTIIDDVTHAVIIDAVTGEFLGYAILPPHESYSMSGPCYDNPCSCAWDSWYLNAKYWFNQMGYDCISEEWPTRTSIQSYIQNNHVGMFYEIAHGNSYAFKSGCIDGTSYEMTYSSDIESWIADYPEMRFAFIASCDGLCDTGPGSFSHAFRKGLNINTATVGPCGMSASHCDNCWYYFWCWQHAFFGYMNQGWTVKDAFDQAQADYPACAEPDNCMRFAGDTTFAGPYNRISGPLANGTIIGTVTDSSGSVSGIQVIARDQFLHAGFDTTVGDGTYSITVPVSVYNLSFSHPDYRDTVISGVSVTEDDTTIVDLVIGYALGACCISGNCSVTNTEQECIILGGLWFKDQACLDLGGYFSCPPEGACCVNDTCVATLIESACDSLSGDWYQYEECPDVGGNFVCPPPSGACCVYGLCAGTTSQSECDSLGGEWFVGELCPDSGGSFECSVTCDEDSIKIEIYTDYFPEETSWELKERISHTVIASYGPLEDYLTLHTWTVCVDDDGCYEWIISDSDGDGICCIVGDGYFKIFLNEVLVDSGGEFGSNSTTHIGSGCPEPVIIDFEFDNGGLTGNGDWEWGVPTSGPDSAYSPTKCWGTNLDGNYSSGLHTLEFWMNLNFLPELGFRSWYYTEYYFDGGNFAISTDNGISWSIVSPEGGYRRESSSYNPLYPDSLFSGQDQQYWEEEIFDLSFYSNSMVKARLAFGAFTSNFPGWYIDNLTLTDCTIGTPEIIVTPPAISGATDPGFSDADTLTIYNSGDAPLEYTVTSYQDLTAIRVGGTPEPLLKTGGFVAERQLAGYHPIEEKFKDDLPGENELVEPYFLPEPMSTGGPDVYGYAWVDSDEPGGPIFSWIDISSIGTVIPLDFYDNQGPFPLGFTVDYYGNLYSEIRVCSNGWASFTSTSFSGSNTNMPTPGEPENTLSIFWDYLDPSSGGSVYYYADSLNSRFIISYDGVPHYNGTGSSLYFQIIVSANGSILYQYNTMNHAGHYVSATIGIENADGTIGLEYDYNSNPPAIHDSLAILFHKPVFWLSTDISSGSIPPGGFPDLVEISMDALELNIGTYTGGIVITSNDLDEAVEIIPVTFVVGGTGTITGTVTDSSGPVAGVEVYADDGAGHTGTDSTTGDGTYSMIVATSVYDLYFSHQFHIDTVISNVTVTLDDTTIVDVELEVIEVPIPTLSEWGMLILALLLLAAGTAAVVRRKRAVSKA